MEAAFWKAFHNLFTNRSGCFRKSYCHREQRLQTTNCERGRHVRVRLYQPNDYPEILRLSRETTYYDSMFMSKDTLRQNALKLLSEVLPHIGQLPNLKLHVVENEGQLVGYMALGFKTVESITKQLQTEVLDLAASSFEALATLIEEARRLTREAAHEYLVVQLQAADQRMQLWFYRLGFRAELNRVVKRIADGFQGEVSPRYVARPAVQIDHFFIVRVNAVFSGSYRPAGRDTDLEIVRMGFLSVYTGIKLTEPPWHCIILEDLVKGAQAGYVMLNEQALPNSGCKGFYTYDTAAAPEYAGRGLSLYLAGAAESEVGRCGGGLLYGDTSVDSLKVVNGDVRLGYTVDSKRFGCDCRS
jgi:hypothetical protein